MIEETEACVVIDVNTGKAAGRGDLQKTILKTNLEAAEEAANPHSFHWKFCWG